MNRAGLALLALFAVVAPTCAQEAPAIPKPAGAQQCVRDTAYMRRYHMTMLKHQRDATVHEGDRSGDFSIAACVNCHVVKGGDGKPVSYADPKHFCRACHDYEAVRVDCFDCHRSTPDTPAKAAGAPLDRAFATLSAYGSETPR